MTSKERVTAVLNRQPVDRTPFWLGNPEDDAKQIYCAGLGITPDSLEDTDQFSVLKTKRSGKADLELALRLHSDLVWYTPEVDSTAYKHPQNKPMFDVTGGKERTGLSQSGVFADAEQLSDLDGFEWPNPDYLDFSNTLELIKEADAKGLAVFSGMWCPFFHVVSDFFGMEEYFIKMHTNPDVVLAVTKRVVDFYLEANRRFLDVAAPYLTAAFFGNDLGSQLDLLISPALFRRMILPFIRQLVAQMKSYHLKVVMHSCGAITRIIPDLLHAGIDALHPLQAKAAGMSAEELAREYGRELIFIGGVDTQELLPFGTPEQVRAEVLRVKAAFGAGYVVSPSHEALLKNVSLANVIAMSEAATGVPIQQIKERKQ